MGDAEFEQAVSDVNNLRRKPSDNELLRIYGLFKQAKVGNVNTSRPGMFDPKGRAKWDAWKNLKGTSQAEAKRRYVEEARRLKQNYN